MTDLEFVKRCAGSDKQAWNEFLERYSRLIYSSIVSALKVNGLELRQDIIHDLFQEIILSLIDNKFQKLKSYKAKNGCSLGSWLRQVALHHSLDYIRTSHPGISIEREEEEEGSLKDILIGLGPSARDVLSDEEKSQSLSECIEKLECEEKYLIEMYLNRGLGIEHIARHLRISRAAVDMRKLRIIEKLRNCFESKGFLLDF